MEPKPRIAPYHQVFLSPNEEVKDKKEEGLPSLGDGAVCWVSCGGWGRRGGQQQLQCRLQTHWQGMDERRDGCMEDEGKNERMERWAGGWARGRRHRSARGMGKKIEKFTSSP